MIKIVYVFKGNIDINPVHKIAAHQQQQLQPQSYGTAVNSGLAATTSGQATIINAAASALGPDQQQPPHHQQQQYLTIIQDPYPPLSSSPELFDNPNNDQLNYIIDCIEIDDNRWSIRFDFFRLLLFSLLFARLLLISFRSIYPNSTFIFYLFNE